MIPMKKLYAGPLGNFSFGGVEFKKEGDWIDVPVVAVEVARSHGYKDPAVDVLDKSVYEMKGDEQESGEEQKPKKRSTRLKPAAKETSGASEGDDED